MTLFDFEKLNNIDMYVEFEYTEVKELQKFLDWSAFIKHRFNDTAKEYFEDHKNRNILINIFKRTIFMKGIIELKDTDKILRYKDIVLKGGNKKYEEERLTRLKFTLLHKNQNLLENINSVLVKGDSGYETLTILRNHIDEIDKINYLLGFRGEGMDLVFSNTVRR